jgi:hypothetical protein
MYELECSDQLEVALVIHSLTIISFDRFPIKMPASVTFDDTVKQHLNFYRHWTIKKQLILKDFQIPQIN